MQAHPTHPACLGETCYVCGAPASHKIGEEQIDPAGMHNLTSYLCCQHFVETVGTAACEVRGCPRPEGTTSFYDRDGFRADDSVKVSQLLRFKFQSSEEWAEALLSPLQDLLAKAMAYHPGSKIQKKEEEDE